MIVWGGGSSVSVFATGGRYSPAADSWTPTSTGAGGPEARLEHTAVWTGGEMIVWGGEDETTETDFNTGARYHPPTDTWAATSTGANVPAPRYSHSAVWTGSEMIVWGGQPVTSSGGRYCTCVLGTWYRDADGDGFGDSGDVVFTCTQPAGYVAPAGDCNDAAAATYPGAPEVNDGLDNQCPGDPGYGVADEVSGASGFTIPGDSTMFCWPAQAGATSYEVARSAEPDFSPCVILGATTSTCLADTGVPPSGTAYFYLVRASSPHAGSWGQDSSGAERILSCP